MNGYCVCGLIGYFNIRYFERYGWVFERGHVGYFNVGAYCVMLLDIV